MSDFMTELAKTAEKMGENIGKGIDSAKLKWAIMRLKSNLEGCYTELGKYISDHRDDLTEDECLEHIAQLYEKIDRMKENIALLQEAFPKAKSVCRVCGRSYKKEYGFCPFCGSKKTEKTEKAGEKDGATAQDPAAGTPDGENTAADEV